MYSFNSRVRYSEINETGALGITALIDYLQDCSTFHSESLGLGLDHVREVGLAWLLSAWEIEIRDLPRLGEEIRVSTWATGFKGLRASRNFTICAADDLHSENPYLKADSSWFMFDANAGRPIRAPKSEIEPYLADSADDAPLDLPPVPHVLRVKGEGIAMAPVVVTAAHLDTNHHVNNAQYVAMALGAVSELIDREENAEGDGDSPLPSIAKPTSGPLIHGLDVHYSTAAKLGDTIYPHIHFGDDEGGHGAAPSPDAQLMTLTVTLDNGDGKPFATVRVHR